MTTVRRASVAVAARQASWIAALEPWRGLGFGATGLARFLRRAARDRQVWVAAEARRGPAVGLLVLQPGVLLGSFVALLAVVPAAMGRGIGRRLMAHAEAQTFVRRRWLFVSADAANDGALRFYRKLGFTRVGRLPDLLRDGRVEVLLRKKRDTVARSTDGRRSDPLAKPGLRFRSSFTIK